MKPKTVMSVTCCWHPVVEHKEYRVEHKYYTNIYWACHVEGCDCTRLRKIEFKEKQYPELVAEEWPCQKRLTT